MHFLLSVAYNVIFIPLLYLVGGIAGIFNKKIKKGLLGRRKLFPQLRDQILSLPPENKLVWIHVSSMGEFEQAKPVIRELRNQKLNIVVLLTFFSPSGYEHSQKYADADVVSYLPIDSLWNARKFIKLVKPAAAVVIRHDIWLNYQQQLKKNSIPTFVIDASIPKNSMNKLGYRSLYFRILYSPFTEILTISERNTQFFSELLPGKTIKTIGDTRNDQVYHRTQETGKIDFLMKSGRFAKENCLVAGSTWPSDESIILPAIAKAAGENKDFKAIIAPHETTPEHVVNIESFFRDKNIQVCVLSELKHAAENNFPVLIIDQIGILANLYSLGQLSFVGGGFGPGVHNVLEPAAHGCIVCFGPRYLNSTEAVDLVKINAGIAISSTAELYHIISHFIKKDADMLITGEKAKTYVLERTGASSRFVAIIRKYIDDMQQESL